MKPSKKFREAFIKWCEEEYKPPSEAITFQKWRTGLDESQNLTLIEIGDKFSEHIQKRINQKKLLNINVDSQWHTNERIVGRGEDDFTTEIFHLTFSSGNHSVVIDNLNIKVVNIHQNTMDRILFENCRISRLELGAPRSVEESSVVLLNSWVGHLILHSQGNRHFEVQGGGIFNLNCPAPDAENPFMGSVIFGGNVFFPRSTKHYPIEGPQPYRNLQAHLVKLENGPAVSFVRAAEQAIERETDTRLNKVLSYLYQWFSNYGSSTLRPVIWLVSLLAFNVWLINYVDGAARAFPDDFYVGWRESLLDTGAPGRASRASLLALQSILNPFGIFGARAMVVAETGWLNIWLGISGLLSAGLIALFILALRRRFKMQ